MLLFCAYISLREPEQAAEELQLARSDILEFDVGALAAAVCSANDANAAEAAFAAVLAALLCIPKTD